MSRQQSSVLNTTASSSIQDSKDVYIYNLPPSNRRLLCQHLDDLNAWTQLAEKMLLRDTDVQHIRRQQMLGNSPTEEVLKLWGDQYNHTVTELFILLKRQKLYQAMRLLKDFVERKYHLYIPNSQPMLSELMPAHRGSQGLQKMANSEKILNCNSTSGVSNSNNITTSDNNCNMTTVSSSSMSNAGAVGGDDKAHILSAGNVKEYASCLLEINYHELTEATDNWNDQFILGKGGFGTVFRGYWKHTEVAIKQIHYRGHNDCESVKVQIQQSLNELKYLNSCRHDNVLPLYGYSIKGEKPCLVYQLMKGGTLEDRLRAKKTPPLTWQQRLDICLGTARGINYLHTFRGKPLIHGDIKPANVLLDQCLQPKIGDFGLAREGPNSINSAVQVTQVFGTKPYLPPEFLDSRKLSTQVDTFSFGVVLLETFTGLRVYDKNRPDQLLTRHILKLCITPGVQLEDVIDRNMPLKTPAELEICKHSIRLGLECISDKPQNRPEMEHVLKFINSYHHLTNAIG